MLNLKHEKGHCIVCHGDAIVRQGQKAHVCKRCFDGLKEFVVWVCLGCEEHHVVEKSIILGNIIDKDFKKEFAESDKAMTVILVGYCPSCDPDGIFKMLERKFLKNRYC